MALMSSLNGYEICDNTARTAALNGVTTAGTGAAYTATVKGITSLTAGAHFVMVPHTVSTTTTPTLNVNSLGAKTIRRRLSNSTSSTTNGQADNWLGANKPVKVMYDGIFWVVSDYVKPVASDVYGSVPVANGGTGADTADGARTNLGIVDGNVCDHNGFYRGKDIQSKLNSRELVNAINDGSFRDLYIGDHFYLRMATPYPVNGVTLEVVRCRIAGFNTFYNNGDTAFTKNHVVIVPDNPFAKTHQMNSTNTTAGGYKGSAMHTTVLPAYAEALNNVFLGECGCEILSRRTLVTNSVNTSAASAAGAGWTGSANNWEWANTQLQLMSEIQVYGANVFSSSGYDTGIDNLQLPLFRLNPKFKVAQNRSWYWLKNVASGSHFCGVSSRGYSAADSASYARGVRPLFCIGVASSTGGGGDTGGNEEIVEEETPL